MLGWFLFILLIIVIMTSDKNPLSSHIHCHWDVDDSTRDLHSRIRKRHAAHMHAAAEYPWGRDTLPEAGNWGLLSAQPRRETHRRGGLRRLQPADPLLLLQKTQQSDKEDVKMQYQNYGVRCCQLEITRVMSTGGSPGSIRSQKKMRCTELSA